MRKHLCISPRSAISRPTLDQVREMKMDGVRMVFMSHAVGESTETALNWYVAMGKEYQKAGAEMTLVINQESHPLAPWSNGNWEEYHRAMGNMCEQIARRFVAEGLRVHYVIWNEGDIVGESSVAYPDVQYGHLLRECFQGIRRADRNCRIYTQGHAAAAPIALDYMRNALRSSGPLPGLIFNRHPYGQYVTPTKPPIPTGWFGRIQQDLATFRPLSMPIAIGEIGVSEHRGFDSRYDTAIATYMKQMWDYCLSVGVVDFMWFAFSDEMRGAGITRNGVEIHPERYNMWRSLTANRPAPAPTPPTTQPPAFTGNLRVNADVNLRVAASLNSTILTILRRETQVLYHEAVEDENSVKSKLGNSNKWVYIRDSAGRMGFVNARFLSLV